MRLGVYEKTLPEFDDWGAAFSQVADAGYDFFELAIDAGARRQARLEWSAEQRRAVRAAAEAAGIGVEVITLSAHREAPWGHANEYVRRRADALADGAIALAGDLGAECVQIAGYFTFEGPRSPDARSLFVDGVRKAAEVAAARDVTLAIENVDGTDVLSAADGVALVEEINHPAVRLYLDVGNFAGNGLDVISELRTGLPFAHRVQLKDARPGEFRRVPFGAGCVPFAAVFDELQGSAALPLAIEMWNDDADPDLARGAATWARNEWAGAQARERSVDER